MTVCYTPIQQPDFFAVNGDCGNLLHDLAIEDGQFKPVAEAAISALIIQLGTDKKLQGQRGFWGDEFIGFPLGTHAWTLTNNIQGDTNSLRVRADEYIREALEELVSNGFFDEFTIRTVETLEGFELQINIFREGESLASFTATA